MAGSGWTHVAPQSSKQSHTLPPTQFDNRALIRKKKALHVHGIELPMYVRFNFSELTQVLRW